MTYTMQDYRRSAEYISERSGGFVPELLLVLGSGLGGMADELKNAVTIPYGDIPHFPVSTAPGHAGMLALGELGGKRVAVMRGRVHCYEGHSMLTVAYPIRVMRLLGAKALLLTNATGAVSAGLAPGNIVLITDHIKLFPDSPLTGANMAEFGGRFPDSSYVYSPRLRALALDCAKKLKLELKQGVYMYFPGPQYETPAEIRAARTLGADVVGMSTVPEAIAANHAGMETLCFSLCSNMAAGILDKPLSEQEVLEAGEKAKEYFAELIRLCVERL